MDQDSSKFEDKIPHRFRGGKRNKKSKPFIIEIRWVHKRYKPNPDWRVWKRYSNKEARDKALSHLERRFSDEEIVGIMAEFRKKDAI